MCVKKSGMGTHFENSFAQYIISFSDFWDDMANIVEKCKLNQTGFRKKYTIISLPFMSKVRLFLL